MLRRVPHDCDHDDADENFGDADGRADAFDRPHEKFRKQRHERSRDDQDGDRFAPRPVAALFFRGIVCALEVSFMRAERKPEHAEISDEQNDRDREGKTLLDCRTPATGTRIGCEVKNRGNNQRNARE